MRPRSIFQPQFLRARAILLSLLVLHVLLFSVFWTGSTAVYAAMIFPPPASSTAQAQELVYEDLQTHNGDFAIHGTMIAPAESTTELPAVVLVAGSGEGVPRDAYRAHAEAFAREGFVTFIYDKRSAEHGYSMFEASIEDLADDAVAAVELLQDRPEVDPDRVGLHGHSEGTWTVTAAANRSDAVAFVIASAPSIWSPDRTQVWMNKVYLEHAGVTGSLLIPLGETLTRHIVDAEMFRLAGHDAQGPLKELDQPLLGVFPEHDRSSPPGESLIGYAKALEHGGHERYQLRVIHDASHAMISSREGFDDMPAAPHQGVAFAPGYVETVTTWIGALDEQPMGPAADPVPPQPLKSSELAPLAPFESWAAHLVLIIVLVVALGSYPVTAVITRLRLGQTSPPATRWPARITTVLGLVIPVVAIGYLGYLMFTAAQAVGPVLLGRPLPWLVLQLGTIGTLVSGLALMIQWWRHRAEISQRQRLRLILVVVGFIAFLVWAAYWGLLTV